jgi:hypothetical protein
MRLPSSSVKVQPKDLFEGRIEVGHRAVHVEYKNRIGQKLQKSPVSPFSPGTGLEKLLGALLGGFQLLLVGNFLGDIPGHALKTGLFAGPVHDKADRYFEDPLLAVPADDFPDDFRWDLTGLVKPVEDGEGIQGILRIHEFAEVAPLDLGAV